MSERFVGTLEWFTGEKGYGFLIQEQGKEVFVPYTAIPGEGFRILTEGKKFEFSIFDGPKGLTAVDIVAR